MFKRGWKSITTIQYYRDLMLARQAWYLYSNISKTTYSIIPIVVNNVDKALVDRKANVFSIDIEVSEAHNSEFIFDNRNY